MYYIYTYKETLEMLCKETNCVISEILLNDNTLVLTVIKNKIGCEEGFKLEQAFEIKESIPSDKEIEDCYSFMVQYLCLQGLKLYKD